MSLQINIEKITGVLLADGWHNAEGFGLDAYELGGYYHDPDWGSGVLFGCEHGGGQSGVCAAGFAFRDPDSGVTVCGPLTAILAVSGDGITTVPELADLRPQTGGR